MHKAYVLSPGQFNRFREQRLTPDELTHVNTYRLLEKVLKKRGPNVSAQQMYDIYHQLLNASQLYKTIDKKQEAMREHGNVPRITEAVIRTSGPVAPTPSQQDSPRQKRRKALRKRLSIASSASASPTRRLRRRLIQIQGGTGPAVQWYSLPKRKKR